MSRIQKHIVSRIVRRRRRSVSGVVCRTLLRRRFNYSTVVVTVDAVRMRACIGEQSLLQPTRPPPSGGGRRLHLSAAVDFLQSVRGITSMKLNAMRLSSSLMKRRL